MASKKFLELQEFSDADLKAEIGNTETQYQKLKFDHAIKGLDNPIQLRDVRRDIARLKSEERRREVLNMSADELANRSNIRRRRRK
jgi:large subunit ribosomal protein L29